MLCKINYMDNPTTVEGIVELVYWQKKVYAAFNLGVTRDASMMFLFPLFLCLINFHKEMLKTVHPFFMAWQLRESELINKQHVYPSFNLDTQCQNNWQLNWQMKILRYQASWHICFYSERQTNLVCCPVCLFVCPFQLASKLPCDVVARRRNDYCPRGAIFLILTDQYFFSKLISNYGWSRFKSKIYFNLPLASISNKMLIQH